MEESGGSKSSGSQFRNANTKVPLVNQHISSGHKLAFYVDVYATVGRRVERHDAAATDRHHLLQVHLRATQFDPHGQFARPGMVGYGSAWRNGARRKIFKPKCRRSLILRWRLMQLVGHPRVQPEISGPNVRPEWVATCREKSRDDQGQSLDLLRCPFTHLGSGGHFVHISDLQALLVLGMDGQLPVLQFFHRLEFGLGG